MNQHAVLISQSSLGILNPYIQYLKKASVRSCIDLTQFFYHAASVQYDI